MTPLLLPIYADTAAPLLLIAVLLHIPTSEPLPSARPPSLWIPSLWGHYPRHGAISSITDPSSIFCICRMYASLSLVRRRKRVLDLTIASDIRSLTNPHIYKYSCFRLLLSSEARRQCADTASVPGIPYVDYTIGVKEHQLFRQGWSYLSSFSFLDVARAFADV